jgi:hypothetical protein
MPAGALVVAMLWAVATSGQWSSLIKTAGPFGLATAVEGDASVPVTSRRCCSNFSASLVDGSDPCHG